VLKGESGFGSALLTGDIEHESEQNMLQNAYNKIKDTDVLLMPHHGSKTSSTTAFIDAVKTQLAIVSAGFLNRFKHRYEKILARYAAENIPILNTADSGWIGIDFCREGIRATPWRTIYKRYWLALNDINSGITPQGSEVSAPYPKLGFLKIQPDMHIDTRGITQRNNRRPPEMTAKGINAFGLTH
jgi:hypothetical protein